MMVRRTTGRGLAERRGEGRGRGRDGERAGAARGGQSGDELGAGARERPGVGQEAGRGESRGKGQGRAGKTAVDGSSCGNTHAEFNNILTWAMVIHQFFQTFYTFTVIIGYGS